MGTRRTILSMLTYSALEFAFQLFEKGFVPFAATRYRAKASDIAQLLDCQALLDCGYASHIHVPAFGDETEVEIEIDTVRNCATYRCPETRKRRDIPLEEVKLLQISREWASKLIADSLSIPSHLQRNEVLLHDMLWKLGTCVLDRKPTLILLARALKTCTDGILNMLSQQPIEPGSVLLSLNPLPLGQLSLPQQMHLVSLRDTFVATEKGFAVNLRYLEKLVTGMVIADKNESLYYFKQNGEAGELCLAGRKKTFINTQAKIIGFLWNGRDQESGFTWRQIQNATHSGSRGIDDAMSGKKNREKWIEKICRSRYRLITA